MESNTLCQPAMISYLLPIIRFARKFNEYNLTSDEIWCEVLKPAFDLKEQDVIDARQLLEDYAAAVNGVGEPDENTLQEIENLHKDTEEKLQLKNLTDEDRYILNHKLDVIKRLPL